MITAADLRACRSALDVSQLFSRLGWPVTPQRVDPGEWTSIEGSSIDGVDAWHLIRHGGVDLYAFEAREEDSREGVVPFLRGLSRWNRVLEPSAFWLSPSRDSMSLFGCRGARRLDVALDAPSADAVDRIASLELSRTAATVDARSLFRKALDRESAGRRFFERFRRAMRGIDAAIADALPEESPRSRRDHSLLLLSRLLFLYFLQQKGWLDGSHRFLSSSFERAADGGTGFHTLVLAPLFFDCLSTPVAHRSASARRLGSIPYLNGGLFARSALEQRCPSLALSDSLWREVLDDTFERFSFCANEDDEQGVHIDPEMLGRVFESLMEVEERAESGTFYTPRNLVDRLASDAVTVWAAEGDRTLAGELRAIIDGRHEPFPAAEAGKVLTRLRSITVIDPACGSGAFLLSAMRVVEALTRSAAEAAGEPVEADLRARIVERSIFGVDLKSEAVRLCELRLWLAIVSASEHDARSVPPLPNLDRNVLQGNSLAGPLDFLGGARAAIYRDWSRALRAREDLVTRYKHAPWGQRDALARALRESDLVLSSTMLEKSLDADRAELARLETPEKDLFGTERAAIGDESPATLRERIASTSRTLARVARGDLEFFAFDVHFAGVLATGGFSIAIGNPPWVRSSRIEPELRRACAERYAFFRRRGAGGFAQSELAVAFVEKSLALLEPGGVFAQLLPSKVLTAEYAAAMRREIVRLHEVVALRDWSRQGKRLFGADVFPLGLVVRKERREPAPLEITDSESTWEVPQAALASAGAGSAWSLADPECRAVLTRLRETFPPLSIALGRMPVMGVKTGANATFFLEDVEVEDDGVVLRASDVRLPDRAVARCVRGRDVRRWSATDSTWMLCPPAKRSPDDDAWIARAARALGVAPSVLRLDYLRPEHLGLKVVWKDLSRGFEAAVLPASTTLGGRGFSVVPNQTVYAIDASTVDEALALSAILNSTVVDSLCLDVAERAKDDHFRMLAATVASTPLPPIPPGSREERALARLAGRGHAGENVDAELDALVASLFGVSERELATLGRFATSRRGERRG
ncbi:MAG: Eco57I restriction-modification methylase domain-containing protein [Thermoanaerobaculia bacterium]